MRLIESVPSLLGAHMKQARQQWYETVCMDAGLASLVQARLGADGVTYEWHRVLRWQTAQATMSANNDNAVAAFLFPCA